MDVGRIFKSKSITDIIFAAVLLSLLIWLSFNGSYASPREQQYDVAVKNFNTQVMNRVIFSQKWWADDALDKANVNTDLSNPPFMVAKTPAEAIDFVEAHDVNAKKTISQYFLTYQNWLKKNRYSSKEITKYKLQPYKLTKPQQRDAQKKLDAIRSGYMSKLKKKVDNLVAEQASIAEERAASTRAVVAANESAANAAKQSASLAAENARISSSLAASIQQAPAVSDTMKSSDDGDSSVINTTSMSSSTTSTNSSDSLPSENDSDREDGSQTQLSTVQ